MKKINLTQDQVTLIDDQDFEFLNQWKWCANFNKGINGYYVVRNKYLGMFEGKPKQKTILMHRIIMQRMMGRELNKTEMIDHINHDSLDNRRENIRIVSTRQNGQNRKDKTTSKYPGVYWNINSKKWMCRIRLNGKLKHLGYFSNEDEAGRAYILACKKEGESPIFNTGG